MKSHATTVVIVGASVRAAAYSALRAGLSPWCADLFADEDLQRHCPAVRLTKDYPHGFVSLLENAPAGPVLYTGGLENHPLLVGQLQGQRRLWGNGPIILVRARAPETLSLVAAAARLPAPAVLLKGRIPQGGSWLLKPRAGAGGIGIRVAQAGDSIPSSWYVQEFLSGIPAAALYVGIGGRSVFLGLTRQLVGESWLCAPPFRYCGSIGPLILEHFLAEKLRHLGAHLVDRTDLHGIFGVDGLLNNGEFWPIEVNPRYTASVEVVEMATGVLTLDLHRQAFEPVAEPQPITPPQNCTAVFGKAVVFAPADAIFPEVGPWIEALEKPDSGPFDSALSFADIPSHGTTIEQGQPILTVFASGRDEAECEKRLQRRAADVIRWVYPGS